MPARPAMHAAAALAVTLAFAGCGGGGKKESLAPGCTAATKPPAKTVKLKRPPLTPPPAGATATVQTNCGAFTIALDTKRAPKTAASFASLIRKRYYDNSLIFRIETGFVFQTGSPTQSPIGGPGYTVDEPPPEDLAYTKGVVAMGKTQVEPAGRSGGQFFVVTAADAGLDPSYALIGKVTRGLDVVERIGGLGTPQGAPTQTVVVKRITLGSA